MNNKLLPVYGLLAILGFWEVVPRLEIVEPSLLPPFSAVVTAFPELFTDHNIISNTLWSVYRNVAGYFVAVVIAVPLGLALGYYSKVREAVLPWISPFRFIPLTALTGLFIANFGIGETMKISFLAFGIAVYLMPTTVQRLAEVPEHWIHAAQTMGANKFQVFKSVQLPVVMGRLFDDLRVLTAIGWTYIVVAESLAVLPGVVPGLGRMAFVLSRTSTPGVFAVLIVITVVGLLQDKVFEILDKYYFPHKHVKVH